MGDGFDLNTRVFLALKSKLPYGDTSPRMDFFEAAVTGDLRRLREMASGKDPEEMARLASACVGTQGPLQAAARAGKIDVVRYMVEELGFDINGGSADLGVTALSAAALGGQLDTVSYLLDNGADPNKKDDSGSVPLHCAAKYGHDEVARLLLSRGASVDIAYFHGTPLHIAAANGKASVIRVLLEHHADPNAGADVNSTDPDTPLVVATTHGLTDCIKYLLKAGADPNIPADSGVMPIQIAACRGRRKDVEILFPFTSPIPTMSKWSVEGIIAHIKATHSKTKVEQCGNIPKDMLKLAGKNAVGRNDYLAASKLYTKAIELDSTDAALYSNRSLCHLHIGAPKKALYDANTCLKIRPEWLKGYYRKGAALMSLKEYKRACDAFLARLKLEPGNAEMERMFWEAVEAMKKDHVGRKNLDSID
ncbi:hypothetical protein ACP4OV_007747 [Aristida adscensionis]